ncbi:MAG: O-antigen polymerase [Staphylococcus epidermidis]|nr:O-antigen polymerase [Staphylococcus epidermidis]
MKNKTIWWISPHKLLLFFLLPIYLIVYFVDFEGRIYFDTAYFWMGIIFLILFILGSSLGSNVHIVKNNNEFIVKPIYLDILAILTLVAYFIWFYKFLINPNWIIAILNGEMGPGTIRSLVGTIPGLTTLTQLGVVYALFYINQYKYMKLNVRRRYNVYLILIFGMTLFRVLVWSERLAFIELLIAVFVLLISKKDTKKYKSIVNTLPYLGIIALFIFFGVTEYFRSWKTHYQYIYDDYFQFVATRILDYYYTALNNGAGFLYNSNWPTYNFEYTLNWLYQFPIIGEFLFESIVKTQSYKLFLENYANPEFNNPSGIFVYFYDLGIPLTMVFILLVSFIIGILYREFIQNKGLGSIIYPAIYIGILEILRIPYLTSSRLFPIILFITLGFIVFRVKKFDGVEYKKQKKHRKRYKIRW